MSMKWARVCDICGYAMDKEWTKIRFPGSDGNDVCKDCTKLLNDALKELKDKAPEKREAEKGPSRPRACICGNDRPIIREWILPTVFRQTVFDVECDECGRTTINCDSRGKAVEIWNSRDLKHFKKDSNDSYTKPGWRGAR